MRPLALFDLDDTLVDRHAALNEWAADFATTWGLDEKWSTYLVFAEAHRTVPMLDFFEEIRREFDLPEPGERLWAQYRTRMAELARCREGALGGLVRLRDAGWRIGIQRYFGLQHNAVGTSPARQAGSSASTCSSTSPAGKRPACGQSGCNLGSTPHCSAKCDLTSSSTPLPTPSTPCSHLPTEDQAWPVRTCSLQVQRSLHQVPDAAGVTRPANAPGRDRAQPRRPDRGGPRQRLAG